MELPDSSPGRSKKAVSGNETGDGVGWGGVGMQSDAVGAESGETLGELEQERWKLTDPVRGFVVRRGMDVWCPPVVRRTPIP